jgi:flagellar biosynthesis/type III secretory pathway protein FliH
MILPDPLEDRLYEEIKQKEGDETMTYILYAERKGLKEGRLKGLKEGIQKGIKKGKIEGLQKAIVSVLEVKFGAVDPSVLEALRKINSLEKLEELLHQAKIAQSPEAFKQLL